MVEHQLHPAQRIDEALPVNLQWLVKPGTGFSHGLDCRLTACEGAVKRLLRACAQLITDGAVIAYDLDEAAAMQGCCRGRALPQDNIDRRAYVSRVPIGVSR